MKLSRLVLLPALLMWGSAGLSFPENTRHGYPSCASCHVSPSGGGALTPYGRGASEAFMATWAREGEGNPISGLVKLPDWFMLGGDQRAVWVTSQSPVDGSFSRPIFVPMEQSIEVAIQSPEARNLTLDVEAGRYGPERRLEYRRVYVKAMLSPQLGMRAGRFLPAYGINQPDHTSITRQAISFGEGAESYNAEAFWLPPGGELIVSGIFGQAATTELDQTHVGTLRTDGMVGWSARAAAYVGSGSSWGVSALSLGNFLGAKRDAVGPFVQAGITKTVFLLAEADKVWERGNKPATASTLKLGWEMAPGLILSGTEEALDQGRGRRIGLQWQPRPHLEAVLEWRGADAVSFGGLPRNTVTMMLHHWL